MCTSSTLSGPSTGQGRPMRPTRLGTLSDRITDTRRRHFASSGQPRTRIRSPSGRSRRSRVRPSSLRALTHAYHARASSVDAVNVWPPLSAACLRHRLARDVDRERGRHVDPHRPVIAERPGEERREGGADADVAPRSRDARRQVERDADLRRLPEVQVRPEPDGDEAEGLALGGRHVERRAPARRADVRRLELHAEVHGVVEVARDHAARRAVRLLVEDRDVDRDPDGPVVGPDDVARLGADVEVVRGQRDRRRDGAERRTREPRPHGRRDEGRQPRQDHRQDEAGGGGSDRGLGAHDGHEPATTDAMRSRRAARARPAMAKASTSTAATTANARSARRRPSCQAAVQAR